MCHLVIVGDLVLVGDLVFVGYLALLVIHCPHHNLHITVLHPFPMAMPIF